MVSNKDDDKNLGKTNRMIYFSRINDEALCQNRDTAQFEQIKGCNMVSLVMFDDRWRERAALIQWESI